MWQSLLSVIVVGNGQNEIEFLLPLCSWQNITVRFRHDKTITKTDHSFGGYLETSSRLLRFSKLKTCLNPTIKSVQYVGKVTPNKTRFDFIHK